jgi:hypothetical protein
MTTGTLTGAAYPDAADEYTVPSCRVCAGPCYFYAGSEHQWSCRECLDTYINNQIARAEQRDQARRDKIETKISRAFQASIKPKPTDGSATPVTAVGVTHEGRVGARPNGLGPGLVSGAVPQRKELSL